MGDARTTSPSVAAALDELRRRGWSQRDIEYDLEDLLLPAARAEERAKWTPCAYCCKEPAACMGLYDDDSPTLACDDCCGHGCEDGKCWPIDEVPPEVMRRWRGEDAAELHDHILENLAWGGEEPKR